MFNNNKKTETRDYSPAIDGDKNKVEYNIFQENRTPIAFDPLKLKDIIENFLENLEEIEEANKLEIINFDRITMEEKNRLNKVSNEYFTDIILGEYQQYFGDIDYFLKQKRNVAIRRKYELIARKLNKSYLGSTKYKSLPDHMAEVEDKVYQMVKNLSDDLDEYMSIFLHHMYFYCSYGKK